MSAQWMKHALIVSVLTVAVMVCMAAPGLADAKKSKGDRFGTLKVDKGTIKVLSKRLVGQQYVLRGSLHQNPKSYYRVGNYSYYYEHSSRYRTIFRIRQDEPVTITSVKGRGDAIEVIIKSSRVGNGHIVFSAPLHTPTIDQAAFEVGFGICFRSPDDSEALPAIVGNVTSGVYHIAECNHLPHQSEQVEFLSDKEALEQGLKPCKLCFLRRPLVTDYATERSLGLYAAQQIKAFGQLSTDDKLRQKADTIGKRILEKWPTPLQGYTYRFYVMEDDEINAYALPTGFVYVNRGLLEMTESDMEIEGVLAHEIAHVERRHSYRIYRNDQKKRRIGAGVGALVGVLAGIKSKDNKGQNAYFAGRLAQLFTKAITNVLYEGYPRSMEEEADAIAALYLQRQHGLEGIKAMTLVMKKLRYYGDYQGREQKKMQAFRSHPLLDNRIAAFSQSEVSFFERPIRIVGMNKQGEEVVTLDLTCQRQTTPSVARQFSMEATQVLGHVFATADIGKPRKLKDLTLTTISGAELRLDNKEDSLIGPYEDEGILLLGDLIERLDQQQFARVQVTLPGSGLTWHISR